MEKDLSLEGKKYNAAAGMVMNIIQKMIDIANEKNFFVYEYINGTLLMIDPGMSAEEGLQLFFKITDDHFFGGHILALTIVNALETHCRSHIAVHGDLIHIVF